MRGRGRAARKAGWFEGLMAVALAAATGAALLSAVRLGAACRAGGEDILAELEARTGRRLAAEREQLRPAFEAARRGEWSVVRRAAEESLARFDGNSQLHLLLAEAYRAAGETGPALREYRRAVELVRDYADRRSPEYLVFLPPWLRGLRPSLAGADLANLNYLARALAGGCS